MPYVIDHASVCDTYLAQLREFVNDILMMKYHKLSSSVQSPLSKHKLNEEIMSEIMTHLATMLAPSNPQLHACEVDHKAENSMFWLRGRGFLKWTLPEDLPVAFQCHDSPLLQIRTAEQLPEFTPHHGEFSCSGNIPTFHTTPHVFRNKRNVYRNSISPGHRAFGGDLDPSYQHAMDAEKLDEIAPPIYNPYPYGHTQLAILPAHYSRDWYSENMEHCDITEEIEEHIKGHGMMSGWVWTAAQAHYHRYWMDADVERPFSSQVIVTDGQFMSFFCYQLNTLAIDPDNMHDNPYRNLCYGSTDIKLYDDITPEGVTGLNDDALKMLIKFAMNGQLLHQSLSPRDEDIEEYNKTLPVQEPDAEYPDLEDQMPLHKARNAEQRQIEDQKREEEAYKQMTYTKRLTNMIGM
uniref:28S ribosomal protein S30, mitochondrial n=1 Tax=Ciona savignyi TaxID=51511 RepID=H2YI40_CIOSA